MTTKPKIAIIGAGPAGCMLARLLHQGGLEAAVFEGEASPDFRAQGGTLDLHTNTGLTAMKEAGLFEEFKQHARYDGQYMAMVDKSLGYHFVRMPQQYTGPMGERPEIDRASLRKILMSSLPEGMIRWGHRLQNIEGSNLMFANATCSGFDLVVGADGAWSKVREAVAPELELEYTGVAAHEFNIPDAANTAPDTYKLPQHLPTCVRADPDWMDSCGYDAGNLEEAKEAVLREHGDWCPELRDAIGRAQGKTTPRSLWILPPGSRWQHKPGFTLIGDAAHVMTPYAGEGVNQSLADALFLARAILGAVGAGRDIDGDVANFEQDMFVRAKKIQQLSYDLCRDWMFTPGAPKSVMAKAISRHLNDKLPWFLHPLGTAGVHSFYFLKNLLT